MTIFQAIILGILFCFCRMGILYTWPKNIVLFGALLIGIVLGDVPRAMIIGAAIQALYIAVIQPGGNIPTDEVLATFVAVPLALLSKMSPAVAVSLAVPVGLLGVLLDYIRRTINAFWVHMADSYAEKGNANGVMRAHLLYPPLSLIFIYIIPVSLAVYLGPHAVNTFMKAVPAWIMEGLKVTGSVLPALGFAITISVIGRKDLIPYFIFGFFFFQYASKINMIALALFGAFLAFLHITFTKNKTESAANAAQDAQMVANNKKLLSKKDLVKSWMLWLGTCELSNSYERLQSLSFAACLSPILKKLYKDSEQLSAALKRHLTFFNTEGIWGSIIPGVVISMEEEKAQGAEITDEMITGLKTGMMGPLAGIGDTVDWGTIRPIVVGLFLPLASAGSWLAGIGPFIICSTISTVISYYLWNFGYSFGKRSILQVLKNGKINQFITAAGVLGMFMMGVLSAQYVKLSLKPKIQVGKAVKPIQSYFDQLIPGLLPIAIVFLIYYLITKKKVKYTTILIGVLVCSLLGAAIKLF